MTKPLFKYNWKDLYLILYTILMASLPFLLIGFGISFWILAIFLPVHGWLITNLLNGPLHHHSHWPTFNNKTTNIIYEIWLSMIGSIPHQAWKYCHLKHHIYVNDKPVDGATKDPMSVFLHGKNGEIENFWSYCIRITLDSFVGMLKIPNYSKPVNKTKIICEQWAFNLYLLSIFVLDFRYGIYMALVYFMSHFLNNATSYGEHWTVLDRRGDTTQDSIGIYSRWYNIIGFGAGYHQEHHNTPSLHWTQLPKLKPNMHPDRVIKGGMHITNNPYWSHFKLLFKK